MTKLPLNSKMEILPAAPRSQAAARDRRQERAARTSPTAALWGFPLKQNPITGLVCQEDCKKQTINISYFFKTELDV